MRTHCTQRSQPTPSPDLGRLSAFPKEPKVKVLFWTSLGPMSVKTGWPHGANRWQAEASVDTEMDKWETSLIESNTSVSFYIQLDQPSNY